LTVLLRVLIPLLELHRSSVLGSRITQLVVQQDQCSPPVHQGPPEDRRSSSCDGPKDRELEKVLSHLRVAPDPTTVPRKGLLQSRVQHRLCTGSLPNNPSLRQRRETGSSVSGTSSASIRLRTRSAGLFGTLLYAEIKAAQPRNAPVVEDSMVHDIDILCSMPSFPVRV